MRNKVTAGLLALFLGGFGIHRFYLGQTFWGIVYLALFWTGAPFILSVLDALLLFVMPQAVFDAKYNRDNQVARRNEKHHRKQSRSTGTRIKKRHQVQSNRDVTTRAKQTILFKKYWENGKKAFKKYQFDEAIDAYTDALAIDADEPKLLFDMACVYAMTEQKEKGFAYIELAIQNGFSDFDRIENEPALAYLRIQDEFLDFAKAGYKRKPRALKKHSPELLEQLRQLDKLKNRGLLTDLEYEDERKKILH